MEVNYFLDTQINKLFESLIEIPGVNSSASVTLTKLDGGDVDNSGNSSVAINTTIVEGGHYLTYTFVNEGLYRFKIPTSDPAIFSYKTVNVVPSTDLTALQSDIDDMQNTITALNTSSISLSTIREMFKANGLSSTLKNLDRVPNASGHKNYVNATPPNKPVGNIVSISNKLACRMFGEVAIIQEVSGTGVVVPSTIRNTRMVFKIWEDTGAGGGSGVTDPNMFGNVVWESDEIDVDSELTYLGRSTLLQNSTSGIYRYARRYSFDLYLGDLDLLLDGNYIFGYVALDYDIPIAQYGLEATGEQLNGAWMYSPIAIGGYPFANYYSKYYTLSTHLETYDASESIIGQIKDNTDSTIDKIDVVDNVVDSIKLRTDNMPQK